MAAKKYIVAVSGGVDSVVLLHKLTSASSASNPQSPIFIVAHFDHGIRADSHSDAEFVKRLALSYGCEFVMRKGELGPNSSEAEARLARYEFLYSAMKQSGAEAIITAHHQDDVIETMLVNILRGTSPRGLIGFTRPNIVRPFLSKQKSWITDYAHQHKLEWREDSTNANQQYLRNYIRISLIPKLKGKHVNKLLEIRDAISKKYSEIDDQIKKIIVQITNKNMLSRSQFVQYPFIVQKEIVAALLRMYDCDVNSELVNKVAIAIKTLPVSKRLEIGSGFELKAERHGVVIVKNQ